MTSDVRHDDTASRAAVFPRSVRMAVFAVLAVALSFALYVIAVRSDTLFIDLILAGRAILCL
jgi:hypothetical protein